MAGARLEGTAGADGKIVSLAGNEELEKAAAAQMAGVPAEFAGQSVYNYLHREMLALL